MISVHCVPKIHTEVKLPHCVVRAVSMSGSALCWWASIKRPLEKAQKLAKLVDCPQDEAAKLIQCLRFIGDGMDTMLFGI